MELTTSSVCCRVAFVQAVGKEVHFAANGTEGLRAVQQAVEKAKEREQQGDTSLRGDEWM